MPLAAFHRRWHRLSFGLWTWGPQLLLFIVLGWQWLLLPGLIMEAIPVVSVMPFWLLTVGAIAGWGTGAAKTEAVTRPCLDCSLLGKWYPGWTAAICFS